MIKDFHSISCEHLSENIFTLIGKKWMLITAGNSFDNFNMMTASWGGFGWLWEKPVSFIFIRPQRYTHEFVERENFYTLSFFSKQFKPILSKLGSVSGRDYNKIAESGLEPFLIEESAISFCEADIIILCRKHVCMNLDKNHFSGIEIPTTFYPENDFHTIYIGEIIQTLIKKK